MTGIQDPATAMNQTPVSPQSEADGPTYWRSIGQLENSEEFQEVLAREFPEGITEAPDDVSRRGFLGAVAASVALAGMTSCRKPETKIVPFTKRPEGFRPGISQQYATTLSRGGYGIGVLVKSNDGRPTKIEGNPDHPSSLGGADLQLQAELVRKEAAVDDEKERRLQSLGKRLGRGGHGQGRHRLALHVEQLGRLQGSGAVMEGVGADSDQGDVILEAAPVQ